MTDNKDTKGTTPPSFDLAEALRQAEINNRIEAPAPMPTPGSDKAEARRDDLTPAEAAALDAAGGSRSFGFDSDISDLTGGSTSTPSTPAKQQQVKQQQVDELETLHYPTAAEFCADRRGLEYLIKRHVQRRALMMVFGQPGSGKSFFVLDQALTVAAGLDEWHTTTSKYKNKVRQGTVLYLTGEGEVGLKQRIVAWAQMNDFDLNDLSNLHPRYLIFPLNDSDKVLSFIKGLKNAGIKPDWIIFDTLVHYLNGDENKVEDAQALVKGCKTIMHDLDCAITLIHHEGKGEQSKGQPRGSSAFLGAMDIIVRTDRTEGIITATQTRNKDGAPQTLTFRSERVILDGWIDEDGEQISSFALTTSSEATERGSKPIKGEKLKNLFATLRACCDNGLAELTAAGNFKGVLHTTWREFYCDPTRNTDIKTGNKKKNIEAFEAGINTLLDNGNIELANPGDITGPDDRDKRIYIIRDKRTPPAIQNEWIEAWTTAAQQRLEKAAAVADHEQAVDEGQSSIDLSDMKKAIKPKSGKKG